jgi:hypothetical protein
MISQIFKYIKKLGDPPVADTDDFKLQINRAHDELLKALDAIDYAEAMALYRRKQIERLNQYLSDPARFVAQTIASK